MLPRLRRILFPTAAAISALLLLAVVIVWPVSYHRRDFLRYGARSGQVYGVSSAAGRVSVYHRTLGELPEGFSRSAYRTNADNAWLSWSYGARAR